MATLKNQTLYEIKEALANFEFEVDEDGVITNAEDLDALEMARDEKVENICLYIKNLKAEAEMIKVEEGNLAHRRKVATNNAERLSKYLQDMLSGETFKSAKAVVSYRKSEQVEIAEGTTIPEEYLRYKDPEPDKVGLKKALKEGATFEGITLVEKQNMSVK